MVLSVSIVTAFQREVRNKVIGFGSHIRIQPIQMSGDAESVGVPLNQPFVESLTLMQEVAHVQSSAVKPGILQTPTDTLSQEESDPEILYSIHGLMVRGAGKDFNWQFLKNNLVTGRIPDVDSSTDILISQKIAEQMKLSVHDEADIYFINEGKPTRRKFTVSGIYSTGLEEYDKQVVFIGMEHIQKLNGWGVQVVSEIIDTCYEEQYIIQASAKSNTGTFLYNWNDGTGWTSQDMYLLCPSTDTVITVISSSYTPVYGALPEPESIPDTAWLRINIADDGQKNCSCDGNRPIIEYLDNNQRNYMRSSDSSLMFTTTLTTSGGSHVYYTNTFEVQLKDWKDLDKSHEVIRNAHIGPGFESYTITDQQDHIFQWLSMLDVNIIIIICLVIMVAVVNMSSAMLVLILERTNAIGILKALGASNWTIRKVFLWNAAWLVGGGLLAGNILAISLILFQQNTGFFTLDEAAYFLSEIPVDLDWFIILLLNAFTLVLCTIMLILPSWLITRVSPVKAIRFD